MPPKHIVAVAGLVQNATGQVLMLLNSRGDWEFPGGQVETGENLIEALKREILEETGIHAEIEALVGAYSNVQSHIVMFDFICKFLSGGPTLSAESQEVAWLEPAEALHRIKRKVIKDRLQTMLNFKGQVTYRAYSFQAETVMPDYTIHEERII